MTQAEAWPDADRLFRSDPRWLGSDDAYSISLDDHRTLWLFGDTFVTSSSDTNRADASFIRNSIGVQTGKNPSSASIRFYSSAEAFFRVDSQEYPMWFWPLHGALIDGKLLLFFMKVRPPAPRRALPLDDWDPLEDWRRLGPLGFFDVYDWEAILVDNPLDDPATWKRETVTNKPESAGVILGASVAVLDGLVYAYGWKDRRGYLARWPVQEASAGRLGDPEWWSLRGWMPGAENAAVVLRDAQTEFTVHFEPHLDRWFHTQLGDAMTLCTAERPEGPWSEPSQIFTPEETHRPGVMAYAGKAHSQLEGADLILTYASIGADVDDTLSDDSIYYPRFVRVTL